MEKTTCGPCGELLVSRRRRHCLEGADGDALVFIEGHDDAILGLAEVEGEPRVVYDRGAIVRRLMSRDGMDEEGAREFFDYNIQGCTMEMAPIFFDAMLRRHQIKSPPRGGVLIWSPSWRNFRARNRIDFFSRIQAAKGRVAPRATSIDCSPVSMAISGEFF